MMTFFRLSQAEWVKLKRSQALRLLWIFPLVYLLVVFWVFDRPLITLASLPEDHGFVHVPVKLAGALWGGFFHPLFLSLLPALMIWPEHKGKLWRHLHVQPISRRAFFASKLFMTCFLSAVMLLAVYGGMVLERSLLGWYNPALAQPFQFGTLAKVLLWLWLGSLPLLALYLWVSDRIQSMAIPAVFGLLGLILTVSLSGVEIAPSWRRDLIPWVLPYFSAQQAIPQKEARQEGHLAGSEYRLKENEIRLPSGKKVKTTQNVPDEVAFPPPPPTPPKILALFSLCLFAFLTALGVWDSGRQRVA